MAKTGADMLVESLLDWGVAVVFGLPGRLHLLNGLYDARLDSLPHLGYPQSVRLRWLGF